MPGRLVTGLNLVVTRLAVGEADNAVAKAVTHRVQPLVHVNDVGAANGVLRLDLGVGEARFDASDRDFSPDAIGLQVPCQLVILDVGILVAHATDTEVIFREQVPGTAGTAGTAGALWWSGTSAPASGTGSNGDYYLNTTTGGITGPKAAGAWGSVVITLGGAGSFSTLTGDVSSLANGSTTVVNAIHGVTVPASPANGQVLTATGPLAAIWQAPTGAGLTPTFPSAGGMVQVQTLSVVSSPGLTFILPMPPAASAPTLGQQVAFYVNGPGPVTITTNSGQSIQYNGSGTLSLTLPKQNDTLLLTFMSNVWYVVSTSAPLAPVASPTFTGTVSGITAAMVGAAAAKVVVAQSAGSGTLTVALTTDIADLTVTGTVTVALATLNAAAGMTKIVRLYGSQLVTWAGVEPSTVTAPSPSTGTATSPQTVGFQFNAATSAWRCVGIA